ncbi:MULTISPECIES: hypothetical protein [unclassified Acidovorax]|uniref:hypothetical protein n=1 Tax=unclassified Acidovorax TaxID=2684926 RepID=UPI001C472D47|nr:MULTISPECIES: hypothetical protein [unclassified Acidovorax]MBV7427189.1 hypothetical protein [Acidovorax sp. sif0732]MBV7448313.1 hypothetical protein [Acidovorax sp. sif0715]
MKRLIPTPPAVLRRHLTHAALLAAALLLSACSGKPRVPDWQMNAQASAQKALEAYLSGNDRVDRLEWDRARAEVARTGRPDLLARLELMRCAAQVASLVAGPCERFEPLRADAAAPERAYADYLAGSVPPQGASLLPEAQRKVAVSGDGADLSAIEDPLSRLVAAGVLFQAGRASPAVIGNAIDAASTQGWRRPLMAWLTLQAQRADAAGDAESASALRRRIAIVEQGAAGLR